VDPGDVGSHLPIGRDEAGVVDLNRIKQLIGKTAHMTFRLVDETGASVPFYVEQSSATVSRALEMIFVARGVPSLGYKTYYVVPSEKPDTFPNASDIKLDADESKPKRILGADQIDKVIEIDQAPIGRTPRSNPATYLKAFVSIREVFAATPDAKRRGFSAGHFSFNVPGGRCETGQGDGTVTVDGLPFDRLNGVEFANPVALRPEGANRFVDVGARARVATNTTALQGSLEKSNADVVRSMVDLIANERWFDANEKVIQTEDDANGVASSTVGRKQG